MQLWDNSAVFWLFFHSKISLMKKVCPVIILFCLTIAASVHGQSPTFNHQAVYVVDLKASTEFYQNVLMLPKLEEPFHDGKHSWFKTGAHCQLHVIQGAKSVTAHDVDVHMSFSVASLTEFMAHLDKLHVKYTNFKGDSNLPQVRPDGVRQVYFQDPDGYWIEVNDDRY